MQHSVTLTEEEKEALETAANVLEVMRTLICDESENVKLSHLTHSLLLISEKGEISESGNILNLKKEK